LEADGSPSFGPQVYSREGSAQPRASSVAVIRFC